MASRKAKLLLELMKGIRLQYAGAMLAIVVTVAIGFISPLMLFEFVVKKTSYREYDDLNQAV